MRNLILFIFLLVFNVNSSLAAMSNYCATPPFLQSKVPSNIMLVLDYSGSMTDYAYDHDDGYDSSKTYYGYFKPDERYSQDANGIWHIDSSGTLGKKLNYKHMTRIDILRWILTGGKTLGSCKDVQSCEIYNNKKESCKANPLCRWHRYRHRCSNKNYCSSLNSQECSSNKLCASGEDVVITEDGTKIKKEDVSTYNPETGEVEGILQQIRRRKQRPRIGAILYKTVSSYDPTTVFERIDLSYEYVDLINKINDTEPIGGTHTKEALEDIKSLFSRTNSNYSQDPYEFDNNTAWCAKNFAVLMSDGEWRGGESQTQQYDPVKPADDMWKGGNADLVSNSSLKGNQNVRTYSVAMFQNPNSKGTKSLKWIAVYGNYDDLDNNGHPCNQSSYPNTSLTVTENLENSGCNEVKKNSSGSGPYGYYQANDPEKLKEAITSVFNEILKQSSSATSVSMLTQRTNKGSIALQAVFYPQKNFNSTKIDWVGYLYGWWLYNTKTAQNLREDTNGNETLDVLDDYILNWNIDNSTGALTINAYNSTAKGQKDTLKATYKSFDKTHPIWEAGEKLANRSYNDRTIYTAVVNNNTDNKTDLIGFDTANEAEFQTYLGSQTSFPGNMTVSNLINYVRGQDYNGTRNRSYDNNTKTWKLGDIVYSTPNVVDYGNYSVAFVGANDGMLHAFRVGYVKSYLNNKHPISIQNSRSDNGTDKLGEELWAFIPRNALPYLRYLADPNYCHMYFVDLKPYVVGVDTNGNGIPDRKILIGGMRFGGAVGCNGTDCINPPSDTCPSPTLANVLNGTCTGLSSYFALDITNATNPKFLWEFTGPDLGFTYSGPAFVTYNRTYYVVFASGPTNYEGDSDQSLKLFVLKLKKPDLTIDNVCTISKFISSTEGNGVGSEIENAFGGRLFTNGIDYNDNGNTDYFFLGVSHKVGEKNNENNQELNWKGNVIAVHVDNSDPTQWKYTEILHNPSGPVVDSVKIARCFDRYFIYFGTGRWFYKTDDPGKINGNDTERIYGIDITPCLNGNSTCSNVNAAHNTASICDELSGSSGSATAWYKELDPGNDTYYKERDIADPTTTDQNIVFFTTIAPTSDICGFNGHSRLWGLNCATGGNFTSGCPGGSYTTSSPKGELLLQLSQGNIVEVKPSDFSGNGTSQWYPGIAPETATPFVSPGGIKGELLLWLER